MLTKSDIEKINVVVASNLIELKKDVVEIKEELTATKETVQGLVTGVDGLTKKVDDLHHEYVALKLSDNRQNRQLEQLANHSNIKLVE